MRRRAQKRMGKGVHVERTATPMNEAGVFARVMETCLLAMVATTMTTMTRMTSHPHLLEERVIRSHHSHRGRMRGRMKC
jgi:hypothetical protein